jgi:hypothetical protein
MSEKRDVPVDAEDAIPTAEDLPQDALRAQAPADREALIRQAAYARYEHRGAESGHDVEDWLAAEAEINTIASAGTAGGKEA